MTSFPLERRSTTAGVKPQVTKPFHVTALSSAVTRPRVGYQFNACVSVGTHRNGFSARWPSGQGVRLQSGRPAFSSRFPRGDFAGSGHIVGILPGRVISWGFCRVGSCRGDFAGSGHIVGILPGRVISWGFCRLGSYRGDFASSGHIVGILPARVISWGFCQLGSYRGDFAGSGHIGDLRTSTPVASLPAL